MGKAAEGFQCFTLCVSFPAFSSIHTPSDPLRAGGVVSALGGLGVTVTFIPQGPGCQGRASWSVPAASCGMFLEPET